MTKAQKDKLLQLLDVVIENYIDKGDPIGSKFLHTLDDVDYAPSTLRKYLNLLEQSGLVYQPYNSSGRIPTIEWLSSYIDSYMSEESDYKMQTGFDTDMARTSMRYMVEKLWSMVDGVVSWFLANDEYFYLGINNLLKNNPDDYNTTQHIVEFIESKEVIDVLSKKMMRKWCVYYSFIDQADTVMSCLYGKVSINNFDGVISIIGPVRVNYKKNLGVLKRIVEQYG